MDLADYQPFTNRAEHQPVFGDMYSIFHGEVKQTPHVPVPGLCSYCVTPGPGASFPQREVDQ